MCRRRGELVDLPLSALLNTLAVVIYPVSPLCSIRLARSFDHKVTGIGGYNGLSTPLSSSASERLLTSPKPARAGHDPSPTHPTDHLPRLWATTFTKRSISLVTLFLVITRVGLTAVGLAVYTHFFRDDPPDFAEPTAHLSVFSTRNRQFDPPTGGFGPRRKVPSRVRFRLSTRIRGSGEDRFIAHGIDRPPWAYRSL
jgi:hypothetical protein